MAPCVSLDTRLVQSKVDLDLPTMRRIVRDEFPACWLVTRTGLPDDKCGADFFLYFPDNRRLRVDAKIRESDCQNFHRDDLALETWSVMGEKVGWTRDFTKQTDYILWYWRDTGRHVLLPFTPLCVAFRTHWRKWYAAYPHYRQDSGTWKSECVFVPREVVTTAMEQETVA